MVSETFLTRLYIDFKFFLTDLLGKFYNNLVESLYNLFLAFKSTIVTFEILIVLMYVGLLITVVVAIYVHSKLTEESYLTGYLLARYLETKDENIKRILLQLYGIQPIIKPLKVRKEVKLSITTITTKPKAKPEVIEEVKPLMSEEKRMEKKVIEVKVKKKEKKKVLKNWVVDI